MEAKKSWMVETIEEAFEKTGNPKIDFSVFPESKRAYKEAQYNAEVLMEAVNECWEPDWDDYNQPKWTLWLEMSPSAFRFCASYCDCTGAHAGGGSRLRVETEEKADYLAKHFPEVLKTLQIG